MVSVRKHVPLPILMGVLRELYFILRGYHRSTIFYCHLIFVGRGKSENKIYNTIQNSGTVTNFPDQNLKIKKR